MAEKEERVIKYKKDVLFKARQGQMQNAAMLIPMLVLIIPMGVVLIGISAVMIVAAAVSGSPDMIFLALMLLFCGLLVGFMGVMLPYVLIAQVPMMFWEDAWFSGLIPPHHLVQGTVSAWGYDEIKRVEVQKNFYQQNQFGSLIVYRRSGKKNAMGITPDTLEIMNRLAAKVPDRIDDSVKEYLIDSDLYEEHPDNTGGFARRMQSGNWRVFVMVGMFAFFAYFFVFMGVIGPMGIIIALVFGAVFFGISLGSLYFIKKTYVKKLMFYAEPQEDGTLKIKKSILSRLLMRQEEVVHSDQVLEVRRALQPLNMIDMCYVKVANGREFEGDFKVFKWAEGMPYYYRSGDHIFNARGHPSEDYHLVRFSKGKVITFIAVIVGPYLLALAVMGLLVPSGSMFGFAVMILVELLFAVGFLLFLPFFLVFIIYFSTRINRINNTTASLEPGKIKLVDHEGIETFIDVKDLVKVDRVEGRFLNCTRLTAKDGEKYDIPLSRYEAVDQHLKREGVMAEEEEGFSEYDLTARVKYEPGKYLSRGFSVGYHGASGAKVIKVADSLKLEGKPKRKGRKKKAPPRPRTGKGALWFQEDEATFEKRRWAVYKIAMIFGAVGLGFIVPGVVFLALTPTLDCVIMFVVFLVLWVVVFGLAGGIMVYQGINLKRVKFYETGVETRKLWGNKLLFFPYGKYATLSEDKSWAYGEFIRLWPKDQSVQLVIMPKTVPGMENYIPLIRERVGKEEFESLPVVEGEEIFDLKKAQQHSALKAYFWVIVILGPILLGCFSLSFLIADDPDFVGMMLIMAGGMTGGIILIMYMVAVFSKGRIKTAGGKTWMMRIFVAVLATVLACCGMSAAGGVMGYAGSAGMDVCFIASPLVVIAVLLGMFGFGAGMMFFYMRKYLKQERKSQTPRNTKT